ncbi:MFS transporter [Desulfovibrio piger]|uniref:MFS transporter n=1 Tax=Desulfovibrio piger TaxID=901 RepID=UPI0032C06137
MSMRSPAPSLGKVEFLVLLWTTFAAFAALYGPQPLLPVIQQHFGVGSQSASLLMTLAILPLGLAPVCYGYILNLCSTRRLLQLTTALCALVLLAASFTTAFWQLLALRTLTGLLIPAILLALMTHISLHSRQESLQRAMAIYTTTTMFGAFLGRIGSGFITSWLGWQAAFLTYALLLGSALPCLLLLQRTKSTQHDVFSPAHLLGVLRQPGLLLLMLIGPLCIFAHASVLNLAPFRMRELLPDAGSWATGLLYVPAFICSLLGIFSKKIMRLLHGEMRTIRCGVLLFLASVPSLLPSSPLSLLLAIFGMTTGFVLVYTTLPGVVNRMSLAEKNMTNGVYLSVYYTFSALGTWLPVMVYSHFGIVSYVLCLTGVFALALSLVRKNLTINL